MKLLLHWIISALAVIIVAYLLPGIVVTSFVAALFVAIVLGLLNTFIRPFLILISLPVEILTLGLFTIVINAGLVLLTSAIVPGFKVMGFWWAVAFSLILWIVNSILHSFEDREENRA